MSEGVELQAVFVTVVIVSVPEIPEVADIENASILFVVRVVLRHPVLGRAIRCIATSTISDVFEGLRYTISKVFLVMC